MGRLEMPDCECPGYNVDVLPGVEIGMGNGLGKEEAAAISEAKGKAEAEALGKALAQFGKHACPPPCISVPIPKIVSSGGDIIGPISETGAYHAFGWAKAQLDVLCLDIPVPVNPPGATVPRPANTDGIAPVGGGSRTR
jgi:hypothetical protein